MKHDLNRRGIFPAMPEDEPISGTNCLPLVIMIGLIIALMVVVVYLGSYR